MKCFNSFLFLFFFILGILGLGIMHEEVHIAIYNSYGIESHSEYFSHFPNFVTIAEEKCPNETCELAHNINEIVGYPLLIFYVIFGVGVFCIINSVEEQNE